MDKNTESGLSSQAGTNPASTSGVRASQGVKTPLFSKPQLGVAAGCLALLIWAYWEPLAGLARIWFTQPDYSHGFLVPAFALYLLAFRKDLLKTKQFAAGPTHSATVVGIGLLISASLVRAFSAYQFYQTADAPSLVLCLAGITLFVGGWGALRWSYPSLVYLVFMFPLPGTLAGRLSGPLQRIATVVSTWLLQLFGVAAVAKGNVIWLTHGKIGVVEACSGLRMLTLFLAITVGASFIIKRPLWEKILVGASALLIAIVTNILRIFVTAFLYEYVGPEWAEKVFHDLAGWLMMPIALLLLLLWTWVLHLCVVIYDEAGSERTFVPVAE